MSADCEEVGTHLSTLLLLLLLKAGSLLLFSCLQLVWASIRSNRLFCFYFCLFAPVMHQFDRLFQTALGRVLAWVWGLGADNEINR